MRTKLILLLLLFSVKNTIAQTIFSENMGSPSGNTAIATNTFQNSASYSYSNGGQSNADVRITNASSGYTGASGGGNVFFAAAGTNGFSIEGINASNYNTLSLQFGYMKTSASAFAAFSVDYWNGTSWITLANSSSVLFWEGTSDLAVWYLSKSLSLPTDAQISGLKIRFVKTGTISIRIDDVKLTGIETLPTVTNTTVTDITTNSATFAGNVSSTGDSSITATGTIYSVTTSNAAPAIGGPSVATISTPSPNGGTGTFSNGSGAVLSPNVQYSYNAYATKNTGSTGYGTVAIFFTLAATPTAPTIGGITSNTLNVTIGSDGNSSITTFAILETNSGNYVQANGTLGTTAVYQTSAVWATKTVTGLTPTTTYTFHAIAKNGAGIVTSAGPSTTGTTLVTPVISTTGTLLALSTIYGTASSFTSFTVSGNNLTDSIIITPPTGFEVSKTSGGVSGYAATQTLMQSGGTVGSTTIYIRLAATTAFGTYSGNINLVSANDGLTQSVATVSSSVAQVGLTISGVIALNKSYDGNTIATLTGTPSLTGVLSMDSSSVTLVTSTASASFADATIGTGKVVTVTGYSLSGLAANNYSLSQPTGLIADITANSSSDIIFNNGSSTSSNSNLNYYLYQSSNPTNTGVGTNGSIGVMGFYLRDGGAGLSDADNLDTRLTAISFAVTNAGNIRSARLFEGNSPRGETVLLNGSSTINFSGIGDIVATDNSQLALNLRVTFNSDVTDNEQLQFAVSSVNALSTGSGFAMTNGGGANSSTAGDINRIEVTADRLAFEEQPSSNIYVGTNAIPAPTLEAIDINGNRDLDFSGNISITSNGTLSSTPQIETANQGLATFDNLNFTAIGSGLTLTASFSSWATSSSNPFTVNALTIPSFTAVAPICTGGSLSSLPTTSNNGITGAWSPSLNNTATTTYTFVPDSGQNATTAQLIITVNPNIVPTFATVAPITAGGSLSPLPATSINGYTGSWSPALNNTETTIYTFTPDTGQCAITTTITITVTAANNTNESLTENYIKTTKYRGINGTNPISNITYYDGIGRPVQKIAGKMSNSGKDIAAHIEYDGFGRQEKEYLPYVSAQNNLTYIDESILPDAIIGQYQTNYLDSYPYSQKKFDNSPQNRVEKQASPGIDWNMGSGHEIKLDYQSNDVNEVKLYKAAANLSANTVNLVNGSGAIFYDANQLFKSIVTNENNNITEEFKDKEGRVIMKRIYGTSVVNGFETVVWHETYYVYDQYGNLTYVIPPLVSDANSQLDDLCYQYKYDNRKRLIEKKLPGRQWELIVYDKLNRIVAIGPALSPFSNINTSGWVITKYDAFNRVVYTGWENLTADSNIRATKQSNQNGLNNFNESKLSSSSTIDNILVNYSNNIMPTSFYLLTVNYYDDYDFPNPPSIPETIEGNGVFYNNTTKPKGLPTSKWVRVLTTSINYDGENSFTLYDSKGRGIRQHIKNHLGGFTQVDSQFEFMTGRLNYTLTTHSFNNTTNSAILTLKDNYSYDSQGRLLFQTNQINGGILNLIAKYDYEELGYLKSKHVGGTDVINYNGLQKVDYKYNIRGWMTSINNDSSNNIILNTSENDLFAFKINYNSTQSNGTPLYNGNIAETYWRTINGNVLKKYGYNYDELNRLKIAIYQEPESGLPIPHYYDESLQYDKNGNIMHLKRNGDNNTSLPAFQIDDLTYNYANNNASNQLVSVTESNLGNPTSGFIDGSNSANEYCYDANGNMTKDENKGIVNGTCDAVIYNHLNLPTKIIFGTTGTIDYIYNAEGKKIEKIVTQNTTGTIRTNYLEGFQYVNSVLQFFPQNEGYVRKIGNNYEYVYNYADHLGNVRLSYADLDQNGIVSTNEILEESSYYPFGLKHSPGNGNNNQPNYKYKYNDKEFQDELGLNMYDFGARSYDPALARWTSIDPVTHFNQSVYMAFDNNPVYFADPSGTTTASSISDAWNQTPEDGSSTWYPDGNGGFSNDPPQEGATKTVSVNFGTSYLPNRQNVTMYYHAGGVDMLEAGWYNENEYFENFRLIIRRIGQGQESIEVLGKFNFTDDVLMAMAAWAREAYAQYGGKVPMARGLANPMEIDSPFFLPGLGLRFAQLAKGSRFAFWSGKGTQVAAMNSGYRVLGQTNAGINLAKLTANMEYSVGSEAWHFWGRLSRAYARKIPKGSTVNVFVTRSQNANPMSIWNRFEKPILEANKVKIKYNFVD